MHNISLVRVHVALCVEAFDKVAVLAKRVKAHLAYAGHYVHIEYYVNRIGNLDADFGKVAADNAHRIGDNVHCSALHRAACDFIGKLVSFPGIHPVVNRTCVLFIFGTYKRSVLYTRNVVDFRAVQIAVRQKIFVEFNKLPAGYSLFFKGLNLVRAAVNPYNFIGLGKLRALGNKVENFLVFGKCHMTSYILNKSFPYTIIRKTKIKCKQMKVIFK